MATKKIPQLAARSVALTGDEELEIAYNDNSYRLTTEQLFKTVGVLPALSGSGNPSPPSGFRIPLYKVSDGQPYSCTLDQAITVISGTVPAGGTTGQFLTKASGTDYDTYWTSEIGTVSSVDASGGTTGLTFSGGPITSSGTLTMAGTLAIANGGTGGATAAVGFDALAPTTTRGDIIARGASSNGRLAIGGANTLLGSDGTDPAWSTVTSVLDSLGSTRGNVLYRGAASWAALAVGTSGYHLQTNGAGADPTWAGFLQAGTGATTRTWQAKAREIVSVFDFGAVGDGSTDDAAAFQAAFDYAQGITTPTQGAAGMVYAPAGYVYKIGTSLTLSKPIIFTCYGFLNYTPTSGSCIVIGSTLPSVGRNTGYKIWIAGLLSVNGNVVLPASINASGTSGIEIRNCQFSEIFVGKITQFTKYGAWLNSSNDAYTGQHIQDNDITLGELGYNGGGVYAESVSAADGAVQVNRITVYNSFSNYANGVFGPSGDVNTNDNLITFFAMDEEAPGGTSMTCYGAYNRFVLGYMDGTFVLGVGSINNRVMVMNPTTTLFAFTDGGTGNLVEYPTADGWVEAVTNKTIQGRMSLTGTVNATTQIAVNRADGGAATLTFNRTDAHAASAYIGIFEAYGKDSAGNSQVYGRFDFLSVDNTSTSEDGAFVANIVVGGTLAEKLRLEGSVLSPGASDGTALGSTALMWSDLFLASGGVINFNNGNFTATHSSGALALSGLVTVASATATPAGGSTAGALLFGTTAGFGIYYGSGAPTVSAGQGSLYLRSDGSTTSTRAYINTNGSTTWTALTTAA